MRERLPMTLIFLSHLYQVVQFCILASTLTGFPQDLEIWKIMDESSKHGNIMEFEKKQT